MAKRLLFDAGERFGSLRVVANLPSENNMGKVLCLCDCGNIWIGPNAFITNGHTKSCGCLARKDSRNRLLIHGERKTPLYNVWWAMIQRCEYPQNKSYPRYGARGISVCQEWRSNYQTFRDWALNNGYANGLTIDRKNNESNYEPSNCHWVTSTRQARNTSQTVFLSLNGETLSLADWGDKLGIKHITIHMRLRRGWSVEDALDPNKGRLRKRINQKDVV